MIATITLNPSIDQHILVPGLVKDDANRAIRVTAYPGGKGVNVSKVVRELGGATHAYALVGGFTGNFWKDRLGLLDIRYSAQSVAGDTRINTILTDQKDGTQTRISAPGPLVKKKDLATFLKSLCGARARAFAWALGGSLPVGASDSTYRDYVLALQKSGGRCVLDTDGEALKKGIEAAPYMIKPNEFEMQRLLGRRMSSIGDYLKAAREIARRGVKIVIVSLGKRGALFVTAEEAFHATTPSVPVKSKVGAGDSLIGGVTLGLSRGQTLKDAAKLGVAASTSAVMREAPRLCLKSDIAGLLKRIEIRDL